MSLGLILCNQNGIVFGSDSLVTMPMQVVELGDMVKGLRSQHGHITKSKDGIIKLIKHFQKRGLFTSLPKKQFYGRKMFGLYPNRNGKNFAGVINVGYPLQDFFQSTAIVDLGIGLRFDDFYDVFKRKLTNFMKKQDKKLLSQVLFKLVIAGYCQKSLEQYIYNAGWNSDKETIDHVKIKTPAIFPIGDAAFCNRLVIGYEDYRFEQAKKEFVSSINYATKGAEHKIPEEVYEKCFRKFAQRLRGDIGVYTKRFTLKEGLKLINFLIKTAIEAQQFLTERPSTVGGDVLLAICEPRRGFRFVGLDETLY